MLDQATLKSLVHYEPETGVFTWLKREARTKAQLSWNARFAGVEAGYLDDSGYRQMGFLIGKSRYRHEAQRLVWLYVYGTFPDRQVDHINRDPSDNRLANLRLAAGFENSHNTVLRKNNTSGIKGVSWDSRRKKWAVRIQVQSRTINLGRFTNFDDAKAAYIAASVSHLGEFSTYYVKQAAA